MDVKRICKILEHVPLGGYVSSDIICEQMGLSKKTVLNMIKDVNAILLVNGAQIQSVPSKGLRLVVEDGQIFNSYLEQIQKAAELSVPETPQERIDYIVKRLIISTVPVSMLTLMEELYISKPTLINDIKHVKRVFEKHHLTLEMYRSKGLEVLGQEIDKRRMLAQMTKLPVVDRVSLQDKMQRYSQQIEDIVTDVSNRYQFQLSDVGFRNLIIHLYIIIRRVESDKIITSVPHKIEFSNNVIEVSNAIVGEIETTFNVKIPQSEQFYIALHLDSKRILSRCQHDDVTISDEIYNYLRKMFQIIDDTHGVDFKSNFELQMNLGLHLIPFLVRLRYGMVLENPLSEDIKKHMAWSYMIAKTALSVIEKEMDVKVDESEVAYVALHFNLALEQRKNKIKKKNIVIVCGSGIGSAELLRYRFIDLFGDYLNNIQTTDVLRLPSIDLSEVDYVITTIPLPISVDRPVLEVGYFFERSDIERIQKLLIQKGQKNVQVFFDRSLFMCDIPYTTKEDVLSHMVERIKKVRDIPDNFFDLIMERERLGYTDVVDGVAIPHPVEAVTKETFVAVGVLDKPVFWNTKDIQLVILLSIAKEHTNEMQMFYQTMSQYLVSHKEIEQTIRDKDFDGFMSQLEVIEQKIEKE